MYKFPPYFRSIYVFPLTYVFYAYPYFDHDAFTNHALHVLDAPAWGSGRGPTCVASVLTQLRAQKQAYTIVKDWRSRPATSQGIF